MNDAGLHFDVDGSSFVSAGRASVETKKALGRLGIDPAVIRKVAVAMYEGEINMVIHANGGTADVFVEPAQIKIVLRDNGPGIADVEKAMQEGFSTATDDIRSLGFGAGMGLANMQKYTDSMEIESTVGVGTTIAMTVNY
jgi:anti-sigma regulatory factor (Ser/Thr protein kinase)